MVWWVLQLPNPLRLWLEVSARALENHTNGIDIIAGCAEKTSKNPKI